MGYDNEKTFATITTTKKEVDYQFWYPRRNKVIKEYKHIKDNYSWNDEYEGELVYSEQAKSKCSPKIYDLRTPLNNQIKNNDFSNSVYIGIQTSSKLDKNKRGSLKIDRESTTSCNVASNNVQGQSLVDLILLEESSCAKCSKIGESYCYKDTLNINGVFGTRMYDTLNYFQQKRTPRAT